MENEKDVKIELVKGTLNDYVIKDKNKSLIGKFTILDMNKLNRKCDIRLKFHKPSTYSLLSDLIVLILNAVYKDRVIFKINFLVSEDINLSAFLDNGFTLEGVLDSNLLINDEFYSELSLGITRDEFNIRQRTNLVEIKANNFEIRNLTPEDAEETVRYYIKNQEYLKNFEPTRDLNFYTFEYQRGLLLEGYKNFINGTSIELGIFYNDFLIGILKVTNVIQGVFKSAILGYSLDEECQGMGFMTQSVNLVLKYLKDSLGLHRVEASTLVDNEKSKSVLLNCGFEEVGLNKSYLFINGTWQDHLTFYKIL